MHNLAVKSPKTQHFAPTHTEREEWQSRSSHDNDNEIGNADMGKQGKRMENMRPT